MSRLATVVAVRNLAFGGPGSGCHGDNCGRPPGSGSGGVGKLSDYADKTGAIGAISVMVYRSGEIKDSGRGVFFADDKAGAQAYSSLHNDAPTVEYTVDAKNAYVIRNQFSLYRELYPTKGTLQDAVYKIDRRTNDSKKAFAIIEEKMAMELRKRGYDALIYTKPPAPATMELSVLDQKSASIKTTKMEAEGEEYFQTIGPLVAIPTAHPPSLRNPQRVKQVWPQDGWHRGDTKKQKYIARQDMVEIMKRVRRQIGKKEVSETAAMPLFPML